MHDADAQAELPWNALTLAAAGVRVRRPALEIEHRHGWATIGTLVVSDDQVEMIPRRDLTRPQYAELIAIATHVAMLGRCVLSGWLWVEGVGWTVRVGVRLDGGVCASVAHETDSLMLV